MRACHPLSEAVLELVSGRMKKLWVSGVRVQVSEFEGVGFQASGFGCQHQKELGFSGRV